MYDHFYGVYMYTLEIYKNSSDPNMTSFSSNKQASSMWCLNDEYPYCTNIILITVAMNVSPLFIVPGI